MNHSLGVQKLCIAFYNIATLALTGGHKSKSYFANPVFNIVFRIVFGFRLYLCFYLYLVAKKVKLVIKI